MTKSNGAVQIRVGDKVVGEADSCTITEQRIAADYMCPARSLFRAKFPQIKLYPSQMKELFAGNSPSAWWQSNPMRCSFQDLAENEYEMKDGWLTKYEWAVHMSNDFIALANVECRVGSLTVLKRASISGQFGYQAYAAQLYGSVPSWPWEELPKNVQEAWNKAVEAVIKEAEKK